MPPTEQLLFPREAAVMLRVDTQTLARWADTGKIAAVRLPSGHRRYLKDDIDRLRRAPAESEAS